MGDLIKWECFEQYRKAKKAKEKGPSIDELTKGWNDNVLPQLKHRKLDPILHEMKEASFNYFKCLKEYDYVLNHYQRMMDEIYQQESYQRLNQALPRNELRDPHHFKKLPLITHEHIRYFRSHKDIPRDVLENESTE
ncbi:hypothetical protein [Litchfieldia alkalitelluris]|uniref:hypothetical protein n=1 Tax=Litchfieldia alkalitelluris TaxID=304268 RepID=UPI000997888E|nr:hypothetical protein [Litchfieldia alkalitelluris]